MLFLKGVVGEGLAEKVAFGQGLRNCVAVEGRMFQAREDHVQGPCGGEPGPYVHVLDTQFCGTEELSSETCDILARALSLSSCCMSSLANTNVPGERDTMRISRAQPQRLLCGSGMGLKNPYFQQAAG